jgi:transposase
VHPGNTSDPTTLGPVVQRVREQFAPDTPEIVMVGDRGMIKTKGIAQLNAAGMRYISALTDAQTLKLINQKVIDPELFDETAADIEHNGRRLILRLNPAMRERDRQRRDDQEKRLREHLAKSNQHLREHPRAKTSTQLKQLRAKITHYRFNAWLEATEENREIRLKRNEQAREQAGQLDGCHTLVTDLPAQTCASAKVCERYQSLQKVERDIRTLKTGQLELRPIYLRKADRTEGHALVTMLALKLTRRLDALAAPEGLTVDDMLERLGGVRLVSLVSSQSSIAG